MRARNRTVIDAPVVRGADVTLDGSGSTGEIEKHEWTYALGRGCPTALPRPAVVDTGVSVTARLLCTIAATLTVTGADGTTDSDTATIEVTPRSGPAWRVSKRYQENFRVTDRTLTPPLSSNDKRVPEGVTWGCNACPDLPGGGDRFLRRPIFCVGGEPPRWGDAYGLATVGGRGPFSSWAYATSATVDLDRIGLMNGWVMPGGGAPKTYPLPAPLVQPNWATTCPPGDRKPSAACQEAATDWHAFNSDPKHPAEVTTADGRTLRGAAAVQYLLTETRLHEGLGFPGVEQSGHMAAMVHAVTVDGAVRDPRRFIETAFAPNGEVLRATIDICLTRTDAAILDYAGDPLRSRISSFAIWAWDPVKHRYRRDRYGDDPYEAHPLADADDCLRPPAHP